MATKDPDSIEHPKIPIPPGQHPGEMAGCICFSFRKAARAITQIYDAALAPSGIRITQFSLMAALYGHRDARRISDLARDLVMDRTTLTRNLRPLEREGLLEITSGIDRRERLARLTDEGARRFREAVPCWKRAQARVLELFGEERWQTIRVDINSALTRALEEDHSPSP